MGGELGVGLCAPTITLAAQGGHSASRPAGRRTQIWSKLGDHHYSATKLD